MKRAIIFVAAVLMFGCEHHEISEDGPCRDTAVNSGCNSHTIVCRHDQVLDYKTDQDAVCICIRQVERSL